MRRSLVRRRHHRPAGSNSTLPYKLPLKDSTLPNLDSSRVDHPLGLRQLGHHAILRRGLEKRWWFKFEYKLGQPPQGIRTCLLALEPPTAPCPVTTTSPGRWPCSVDRDQCLDNR